MAVFLMVGVIFGALAIFLFIALLTTPVPHMPNTDKIDAGGYNPDNAIQGNTSIQDQFHKQHTNKER